MRGGGCPAASAPFCTLGSPVSFPQPEDLGHPPDLCARLPPPQQDALKNDPNPASRRSRGLGPPQPAPGAAVLGVSAWPSSLPRVPDAPRNRAHIIQSCPAAGQRLPRRAKWLQLGRAEVCRPPEPADHYRRWAAQDPARSGPAGGQEPREAPIYKSLPMCLRPAPPGRAWGVASGLSSA